MGDSLPTVTVYTSIDGRPINKIVRRLPDGSITKGMVEHKQNYHAEHRVVADVHAFAELLREIGARPDMMLSPSVFVDPPVMAWDTWSTGRLARAIGCAPTDNTTLRGWHSCERHHCVRA